MSYTGPDRREDEQTRRFVELELRMNNLERKVDENILMTTGVFDIVQHGKAFFSVLGLIGNVVKWAGGIVIVVAGAWAIWTGKN
jgi:hypothetical protein